MTTRTCNNQRSGLCTYFFHAQALVRFRILDRKQNREEIIDDGMALTNAIGNNPRRKLNELVPCGNAAGQQAMVEFPESQTGLLDEDAHADVGGSQGL